MGTMLREIFSHVRAFLVAVMVTVLTVIGLVPLLLAALLKLVVPIPAFRRFCAKVVLTIAEWWVEANRATAGRLIRPHWDIRGDYEVSRDRSYIAIVNHQSWVDIPALLEVFNRRAPFFKFFLKQELIWVPLLGLAWWALDYPMLKRYSKETLKKHPGLKGRDLEKTRAACEKTRGVPQTVVSFPEGTRFTPEKHRRQDSPYRHLLTPRAGGVAFALAAIGDQIDRVLDVTIHYPHGTPTMWQLLQNRVPRIVVYVRQYPLEPEHFQGDYREDPEFRARFQAWINDIWQEKDRQIEALTREDRAEQ